MNKRELKKLKKWTDTLTDEQLKKEYYDTVYQTLGSQCEEMYEEVMILRIFLKERSMKKNLVGNLICWNIFVSKEISNYGIIRPKRYKIK